MRIVVVLAIASVLGCDSDSFLSGQWTSVKPTTELTSTLDLHIELNLGHFGSDVVGVARFVTTEEYQFTPLSCEKTDTLPACPCVRINGIYRSNKDTLYMELPDCGGQKRDLILNEGGAGLTGTLETPNGQTIDLEFEETKSERQLTTSDRSCDECPKLNE